MLRRVKAKKDKSLASSILESMTMTVTLSDRLRRAGIRECEPDYETKTGNLGQNRKNKAKKGLAEKRNERNKKLQNLCNEFYSPYFKDCYQNKTTLEKHSSKNYAGFSKSLRRKIRGSAKKTIFASLDFINDCQKYRKKVTNPEKHSELKTMGKIDSAFSNHKQNVYIEKEPQKLHVSKTYSQLPFCDSVNKKEEAFILDVWDDKEAENSCVRKDISFFDQNTEKVNKKEESINDQRKSQSNKKISETLSYAKPFFDEFPSGDVARIDKKYLESLLSITNTKDKKYANEGESKNIEEAVSEKNGQRKGKKKSNKITPENKIRIKKSEERKGATEEMEKDSESTQIPSYKNSVLAKIVRDSTKSEAQIFVQKKFKNQRNSEMKSEKNVTRKKSEVNDIRKNRKNRNKLFKNKSREFSDSVFSNEFPKVVDLKELWRRDIREKSENSLSSNSSCTVPKSDADSEQKNLDLESYKFLKKFVEEVKKTSNESEKKNNLKETESIEYNFKTNEFKSVNLKESEKVENICKKLKISMAENVNDKVELITNEMGPLKKKLIQAEHPQHYSIYEGEKINSTLLSALAEDKLKNPQGNKKLFKENERNSEKTPSQIINNWSILNRLEQAFLALGTPNFQDKNKKSSTRSKGEELISKKEISGNVSKKSQNHLEKISKEPQKSKEVEKKNNNKDALNTSHSTSKIATQNFQNKTSENDEQRSLIKDDQGKNKSKKESKQDCVKITEDKKIDTIQERRKISDHTIHENSNKKKPIVKSLVKPKLNVHEPRQSGRKQDKKSPSRGNAQAKKNEPCHEKLPNSLGQNKNSEETLEKEKSFNIIQKKDVSNGQPRKSKSCDKTDDDFKQNDMKIPFSQTKKQELKKNNFLRKNITNEVETKTKSFIPKKLKKIPIKTKSRLNEKCKTTEVECSKERQKSSVKILPVKPVPQDKTDQENPRENEKQTEELPTQIQEKKLVNNPSEKVIKERSILSISGKQQICEEPTKKLMQIEGKSASDFYSSPHISNTENSENEKSQSESHDFLESITGSTQQFISSAISSLNVSNFKLMDSNSAENQKEFDINSQESSPLELSKNLTPLSNFSNSNSTSTQQVPESETGETEPNFPRRQTKMLWERDIRHYHAIVKEIMSHYDRIDGFLTYSDYLQSFSNDSVDLLTIKNSTDKESTSGKRSKMNFCEYRKKIMSEYQALPIFEYKRLMEEKKEGNLLTKESKKRNLAVVKDVTAEMDLDVKDFQPQIQKVLDSQFYVDVESRVKRNYPRVKLKEKKSSLQEIVLSKNVKMADQEHLNASSMIKTFSPLPSASVCADSSQKLKTMRNFLEDSTETITSTSIEEIESENL